MNIAKDILEKKANAAIPTILGALAGGGLGAVKGVFSNPDPYRDYRGEDPQKVNMIEDMILGGLLGGTGGYAYGNRDELAKGFNELQSAYDKYRRRNAMNRFGRDISDLFSGEF